MALVIAGERSGVGKTTITLMLLAALKRGQITKAKVQSGQIQSFKVGPDYIDPMFHSYVTGQPCYNLDPVLTSEAAVQDCFNRHQAEDYTLVEGVMGLFDGTVWTAPGPKPWDDNAAFDQPQASAFASTAHIAKLLDLPVLLVIDCSRLSGSVAAIAQGYATLDPAVKIAGLILNRVGSDRHLNLLKTALAPLDIPVLGVLRRHKEIELPDRHLGLVPTDELPELEQRLDRLAEIAAGAFDWEQLLPLLQSSQANLNQQIPLLGEGSDRGNLLPARVVNSRPSPSPSQEGDWRQEAGVRIGVARDRAFNFYYAENLELLRQAGADLVFWSPLDDDKLPENLQGLIFGGGFPEIFAQELSGNPSVLESIYQAIHAGIPTYAECGGLMYLCKALRDLEGRDWSMVGVLPATAVMGGLTLGYRRAIAQRSTPLLETGNQVWGHEFHHSKLLLHPNLRNDAPPLDLFELWGNDLKEAKPEGMGQMGEFENLHASYIHLHWGDQVQCVHRFINQCQHFQQLTDKR